MLSESHLHQDRLDTTGKLVLGRDRVGQECDVRVGGCLGKVIQVARRPEEDRQRASQLDPFLYRRADRYFEGLQKADVALWIVRRRPQLVHELSSFALTIFDGRVHWNPRQWNNGRAGGTQMQLPR